MTELVHHPTFTMAALEAATQPAHINAPNDSFRSLTLAGWVAGSSPAMVSGRWSGDA
jgi:hypothetical protein